VDNRDFLASRREGGLLVFFFPDQVENGEGRGIGKEQAINFNKRDFSGHKLSGLHEERITNLVAIACGERRLL